MRGRTVAWVSLLGMWASACAGDDPTARLILDVAPCMAPLSAQACAGVGGQVFTQGGTACLVVEGPGGDTATLTFEYDDEARALRRTAGEFDGALKPGELITMELLLLRPGAAACPDFEGAGRCGAHDECAASLGLDAFPVRADGEVRRTYGEGRACTVTCHADCSVELCDGDDDDCDGAIDEGFGVGEACTAPGACGEGRLECTEEGAARCDVGPEASADASAPEICDGADNDCDGEIDERTGLILEGRIGVTCGGDVGACRVGFLDCADGTPTCEGEIGPAGEVCDGLDNDCDGEVDELEDLQAAGEVGGACAADVGACSAGVLTCVDRRVTCVGASEGAAEVCDGVDNDCDGEVDEAAELLAAGTVGQACGSDEGECTPGLSVCLDGALGCDSAAMPSAEVCDGADNDCDGQIDEQERPVPTSLHIALSDETLIDPDIDHLVVLDGAGEEVGRYTATGPEGGEVVVPGNRVSFTIVTGGGVPRFGYRITEITDQEGNVLPGPYPESPHPYLAEGDGPRDYVSGDNLGAGVFCGTDVGECRSGLTDCLAGQLLCRGALPPTPEICDGLDNACDGTPDEPDELTDVEPCAVQLGACQGSVRRCTGAQGYLPCQGPDYGADYQAPESRCDCVDNDCDGFTDEVQGTEGPNVALMSCGIRGMRQGVDRTCVVTANSGLPSGEYTWGDLTIAANASVSVHADSTAGFGLGVGFEDDPRGGPGGGGHLVVRAHTLFVDQEMGANTGDRACSGGDLWLFADDFELAGFLRANGAGGFRSYAGGAAGSLMIMAERSVIRGASQIVALGGGAADGTFGGGPGGVGGSFRDNDRFAASSGGPGGIARAPGDPRRPMRLAGAFITTPEAIFWSRQGTYRNGDFGACTGLLELWGGAILLADHPNACGAITQAPLAVRVRRPDLSPIAGATVRITDALDGAWASAVTDAQGWQGVGVAAPVRVGDGFDYTVVVELPAGADPPEELGGEGEGEGEGEADPPDPIEVFISYAQPEGGGQVSRIHQSLALDGPPYEGIVRATVGGP